MKRIGFLLFVAILIVCNSCRNGTANAAKKIESDVETWNALCPIVCWQYYNPWGDKEELVIEEVTYVNNALTFSFSVGGHLYGIKDMEHNMKMLILSALVSEETESSKRLVQNIIDSGGKIVYYFHTTSEYSAEESFLIEISNKELAAFFSLCS